MISPDMSIERGSERAGFLISPPMTGPNSRPANANVMVAKNVRVGWFFKLKVADPAELDGLMDETAYQAILD